MDIIAGVAVAIVLFCILGKLIALPFSYFMETYHEQHHWRHHPMGD